MDKGQSRKDKTNAMLNKSTTSDMQKDLARLERRNTRYRINATNTTETESILRSTFGPGTNPAAENGENDQTKKDEAKKVKIVKIASDAASDNRTDPLYKSKKSSRKRRSNSEEKKGKKSDKGDKNSPFPIQETSSKRKKGS